MHKNAAGFSIKTTNIDKLINFANEQLKDINFNEGFYEADFIVNGNCSYLKDLIIDIDEGKEFFGQGNKEPIVVIENIIIDKKDIQIIGSNEDTVKFIFNDIEYIKFKDRQLSDELKQIDGKITVTVVGKCSVNKWRGLEKP